MLTKQNWISEIMIAQIPRHSSLECLVAEVQRKNSKAVLLNILCVKIRISISSKKK